MSAVPERADTARRSARFRAVVPAAGVGKRMGGVSPKQYMPLAGKTIIEHSVGCLLAHPRIEAVCVVLADDDGWWPDLPIATAPDVIRARGGAERCHSVLNGLDVLAEDAGPDDWVLVHDAARPCLRQQDIDALLALVDEEGSDGGILAHPVRDTMKRQTSSQSGPPAAADGTARIEHTVEREGLWHAYTPQMFRLAQLREALSGALAMNLLVTDEASAMEAAGFSPSLVEGHADNIKVTHPDDLALAGFYLARQIDRSVNRPINLGTTRPGESS